jgi:pilus assembly protein CpaC
VKNVMQVQLAVRVAEVTKNRMRDLGTSYAYQAGPGVGGYANSGQGPSSLGAVQNGLLTGTIASSLNLFLMGGNTLAFIRALQQQGALRALAEPNLIAMNGQTASFLAGGEYPVPVVQGSTGDRSTVTVIFKEYGVRLNFKPTILDEDHIRLELEPEVSTLDFANGVKFEGFQIPALRTRRAKTGIELRDGQSFALAGLLDNNETQTLSKVPGLGDVPILGNLFRSKSFQKNESELMFIVTAQIVNPVNRDDLPRLPNVENMKNGSLLGVEPKSGELTGPTGFSLKPSGDIGQSEPANSVTPSAPTATPSAPTKDTKGLSPSTPPKTGSTTGALAQPISGAKQEAKLNQNP